MRYKSTKLITGLSTCFRQWRADSHCNKLHGYALEFKITYACDDLDIRNWVMDFGGLKALKEKIQWLFDHTVVFAADDPALSDYRDMNKKHWLSTNTVFDNVGCEAFAYEVWKIAQTLCAHEHGLRVWVESVECIENKTNSAFYYGKVEIQKGDNTIGGDHRQLNLDGEANNYH